MFDINFLIVTAVACLTEHILIIYEISNDQDGDEEGWVSYCPKSYSLHSANQKQIFINIDQHEARKGAEQRYSHTLCYYFLSGNWFERPPATCGREPGLQRFKEISTWTFFVLYHFYNTSMKTFWKELMINIFLIFAWQTNWRAS